MTLYLTFLLGAVIGATIMFVTSRLAHLRETQDYVVTIKILELEMSAMDQRIQELQNQNDK